MKKFQFPEGLRASFVVGSIALVFLIIGYQTALFVHSAAVVGIASHRDDPDTVFLVAAPEAVDAVQDSNVPASASKVQGYPEQKAFSQVRRSSGAKTPVGEAVRQNIPRRKVESFRFNPNTVSEEDLQRLGFSPKQAASIVNYRLKGGRFRRKSDFAKSFVVSDSVFRRLEPFIDIPLVDLNLADSAAFDALPGIGGWFAKAMVQYRERLGGYSCPEQLMEIRNFDREKFDALSDLICVDPANLRPYPLWELPEEQLRRHPHIGPSAHAIVLFRQTFPRSDWTISKLKANGILTPEKAELLYRCVIAPPE
ncbi:MAG: helix-hairpin-helix domain-containing protein [Candidatus Cryptobacteroides sp.]|nr:helix-hairpin-helix domain-containing protein [Candidatus Cryptobacteroides sp.]